MIIAKTAGEMTSFVTDLKQKRKTVGFVPTMGALHAGHLSLVKQSQDECDVTIVSIFVNPKQFGPTEDFDRYPRPLDDDIALLKSVNVNVLFCPSVEEMYPSTLPTFSYTPPEMATWYCGEIRPHFFQGVCSVVHRLFTIVTPNSAFFGEKDYQQLTVISQMVRDLALPIRIIGCPIQREEIGLAMSSRNRYLSKAHRLLAATIYSAYLYTRMAWLEDIHDSDELLNVFHKTLSQSVQTQYAVIVDPHTLVPQPIARPNDRLLFAGVLGTTRLIDNFPF